MISLQYFQAVQEGRRRASQSQMKLFDAAGFAMLTLTTKKVDGKFVPVGQEDRVAAIRTEEGHVVVLCDTDGFTKAQSKPIELREAADIVSKLTQKGMEPYNDDTITIWTRTHKVLKM